ncbi:MAG: leucyl aminopeptidase family protein [Phycisphaerales bacterium]|nr:MAG: leucyl aminopeptidase family protein [Phycisphaerales bacterium]
MFLQEAEPMFQSVSVSSRAEPDATVLAVFNDKKLDPQTKDLDPEGLVADALKRADASGECAKLTELFPDRAGHQRVIVLGLGDRKTLSHASLRTAFAALGRKLAACNARNVLVDILGPLDAAGFDHARAGALLGETLGLLAWHYDGLRGNATAKPDRQKLTIQAPADDFLAGVTRGLGIAESTNYARTLSQTPPNIANPTWIAAEAKRLARKTGLTCTVLSGEQLEKERLHGIATVGAASNHKPCLIRLEYKPKRGRSAKPAVLVGKTVTYDTGGLSLKISGGMVGMKRDKDGGCAVLGAMHAVATVIQPDRPVVALLAVAENSISDEAYRPDDVITFRNGVTVEVTNTDAEGRLVLADALIWAHEKEKPAYVVDVATLTGGVVVALGKVFAGYWCDDEGLRTQLEAAADAGGEAIWRLPHHNDYREMMRSPIADIVNSAPVREAHPIQGAAFLSYFCDGSCPWAHIDIAGTHATAKDAGPFIPGPTGFGVRLLAELLEQH